MRNAFAAAITRAARDDPRVVLLSGDIGNRLFDEFKQHCPDRFYNCGVAEANMTGVAAGLAAAGLKPFTYTITPFATTRALEQIRVDICYHNLPVTVVGTGSGLSYASLGPTHHSCEDIAFLRAIPNMTVVCPGDRAEVTAAVDALVKHDGPAYLRIGKKGEPLVHTTPPRLMIGKGIVVRDGVDVCLFSTGNVLPLVVDAAALLNEVGVSARVVSLHTVKPLDDKLLEVAFDQYRVVAVAEEHGRIGGLGGAVAEWLVARRRDGRKLLAFGTPDEFLCEAGSQEYMRERVGLTAGAIAERVRTAMR